ncbi:MAG: undecaprenyl/decaprenyl-phosphate alpha-N-acetylglucosaminyl 1-phosphate transferase [Rhodospirillales bacterium]|nr:undecaprenyl/decaprenyl-phosphate alpha-N-acetylglucosaminyl 1-phosphate transferase [Rhodospirillales bacterium]
MTAAALLKHLLFGGALTALSAAATWLLLRQRRFLDAPNERSSHATPIPRSGGLAITLTAAVGIAALYVLMDDSPIAEPYFIGFIVCNVVIVGVSLIDDLRELSFRAKLLAQCACAAVVLSFGLVIDTLPVPLIGYLDLAWVGYAVTLLWIVGLTNAFNFMDGLDGLAGGTAVIVGVFFSLIAWLEGSLFVYLASYVVVAAALGFLAFNFPPARIFMGDVGSQFIGFFYAVLAVIAGRYDAAHTSFLVMPLLFFNFIWDTAYTVLSRWRAGEDVTKGHRRHLYQLLNRLGYSHRQVTLYHYAVTVAQGLGALAMIRIEGDWRLLAFLPFVLWQIAYTRFVAGAARRQGLIA